MQDIIIAVVMGMVFITALMTSRALGLDPSNALAAAGALSFTGVPLGCVVIRGLKWEQR